MDHRGRLFIDRDPELFGVLLQFLRAGTLPSQQYIRAHREALLEECKFFHIAHLEDRIHGHTSIYDLRLQDRLVKEQDAQSRSSLGDSSVLVNLFATNTSPLDPIDLELPLLKATTSRVAVNCDYATFFARYHALAEGLVGELAKLPGIAFAGGSVVGALTQSNIGDRKTCTCTIILQIVDHLEL